jgi:hypothetical protein
LHLVAIRETMEATVVPLDSYPTIIPTMRYSETGGLPHMVPPRVGPLALTQVENVTRMI